MVELSGGKILFRRVVPLNIVEYLDVLHATMLRLLPGSVVRKTCGRLLVHGGISFDGVVEASVSEAHLGLHVVLIEQRLHFLASY